MIVCYHCHSQDFTFMQGCTAQWHGTVSVCAPACLGSTMPEDCWGQPTNNYFSCKISLVMAPPVLANLMTVSAAASGGLPNNIHHVIYLYVTHLKPTAYACLQDP